MFGPQTFVAPAATAASTSGPALATVVFTRTPFDASYPLTVPPGDTMCWLSQMPCVETSAWAMPAAFTASSTAVISVAFCASASLAVRACVWTPNSNDARSGTVDAVPFPTTVIVLVAGASAARPKCGCAMPATADAASTSIAIESISRKRRRIVTDDTTAPLGFPGGNGWSARPSTSGPVRASARRVGHGHDGGDRLGERDRRARLRALDDRLHAAERETCGSGERLRLLCGVGDRALQRVAV